VKNDYVKMNHIETNYYSLKLEEDKVHHFIALLWNMISIKHKIKYDFKIRILYNKSDLAPVLADTEQTQI